MNVRDFKGFLTIAKYMSITEAARELYVTQPTLSRALARLEEELGVRLFEREGNKLRLTAAGHTLHDRFLKLNEDYEDLMEAARSLSCARPPTLTVGFNVSFYVYAQTFMGGFLTELDGVSLASTAVSHGILRDMLFSGRIDYAVSYVPVTGERLACRDVLNEELVLMVSPDHPLAAADAVSIEDLAGYRIAALPPDDPFRVATDSTLASMGLDLGAFEAWDYAHYAPLVREARTVASFASEYGAPIYPEGYVCLRFLREKPRLTTYLSWLIEGGAELAHPGMADRIALHYRASYGSRSYELLGRILDGSAEGTACPGYFAPPSSDHFQAGTISTVPPSI